MAENRVICIARQFGSGGHDIGFALAQKLDIPFYDKELLKQAAAKSGIVQELFEKTDEKPSGSLFQSFTAPEAEAKASSYADYSGYLPNDRMQKAVADVIREVAEKSSCVIIGRCADYVLRGRNKAFSVFIHAPLEKRISRIAHTQNLDEDAARALVRKTDRSRANYYSFYTDREWAAAANYDLVINAGRLGADHSVALIVKAAELF